MSWLDKFQRKNSHGIPRERATGKGNHMGDLELETSKAFLLDAKHATHGFMHAAVRATDATTGHALLEHYREEIQTLVLKHGLAHFCENDYNTVNTICTVELSLEHAIQPCEMGKVDPPQWMLDENKKSRNHGDSDEPRKDWFKGNGT